MCWPKDSVATGEIREWVTADTESTTESNNDILNKLERISIRVCHIPVLCLKT